MDIYFIKVPSFPTSNGLISVRFISNRKARSGVVIFFVFAWACDRTVTSGKPRDAPLSHRWRDFLLRERYVGALKLTTWSVVPCIEKTTIKDTQGYRNLTFFISGGNGGGGIYMMQNRYGNGFILTNFVLSALNFFYSSNSWWWRRFKCLA
jgi:hypothetical protein